MVICIILSSLALAAAIVGTAVAVREGKRNCERNAAEIDCLGRQFPEMTRRLDRAWAGQLKEQALTIEDALWKIQGRIDDLERGAVPDYEKAKAAAKAVDDFHEGLASILNYDPYEAIRASRTRGEAG